MLGNFRSATKPGTSWLAEISMATPVPLREYMGGSLYARAEASFQCSLNPFVKKSMQAAFPTDHEDASDPYNIALAELQQAVVDRRSRAAALRVQLTTSPDPSTVRLPLPDNRGLSVSIPPAVSGFVAQVRELTQELTTY